jgi:transketolase
MPVLKKSVDTIDYSKFNSMRGWWAWEVFRKMQENPNIYLVTGDLGYGMWDQVRESFPHRFINVGAAEVTMMSVAVGLALSGKLPVVYSITSFALRRAYEPMFLYMNRENLKMIVAPAGRDNDYSYDGASHWSFDTPKLVDTMPYIRQYYPETKEDIPAIAEDVFANPSPCFVSLRR